MTRVATAAALLVVFEDGPCFCILEKLIEGRLCRWVIYYQVLGAVRVARVNFRCNVFIFHIDSTFTSL